MFPLFIFLRIKTSTIFGIRTFFSFSSLSYKLTQLPFKLFQYSYIINTDIVQILNIFIFLAFKGVLLVYDILIMQVFVQFIAYNNVF